MQPHGLQRQPSCITILLNHFFCVCGFMLAVYIVIKLYGDRYVWHATHGPWKVNEGMWKSQCLILQVIRNAQTYNQSLSLGELVVTLGFHRQHNSENERGSWNSRVVQYFSSVENETKGCSPIHPQPSCTTTRSFFFFFCVPQLYLWFFCCFCFVLFFLRSPAISLGFTTFGWDFCVCDRFFNPTSKVVTFRLRGWCVLGVFLLPAFTRLGHERQDLLSPCDEMHVCTD